MGGGQAAARGKDARTSAALPGKHSSGAGFVGAPTVTEPMPANRSISSNRPVSAHAVAAPATAAGAIMVDVSKKAVYLLCAAALALGHFNESVDVMAILGHSDHQKHDNGRYLHRHLDWTPDCRQHRSLRPVLR